MTPQRRKPRSRVRTWSLATLNRSNDYLLFWHQGTHSWEVVLIDRSSTVITRENVQQSRKGRPADATEGAERRGLSGGGPSDPLPEDA